MPGLVYIPTPESKQFFVMVEQWRDRSDENVHLTTTHRFPGQQHWNSHVELTTLLPGSVLGYAEKLFSESSRDGTPNTTSHVYSSDKI